jgi:hypothetical protein
MTRLEWSTPPPDPPSTFPSSDIGRSKMAKEPGWFDRPLMSRIAGVMYPNLVDPETKKQMDDIAKANGKRPPGSPPVRSK